MQVFSAILTCIVLYLTVLPCGDPHAVDIVSIEICVDTQGDQNQTNHSDSDRCSPFCTCGCTSVVFIANPWWASTPPQEEKNRPSYYQEPHSNGIGQAVWHPPKHA